MTTPTPGDQRGFTLLELLVALTLLGLISVMAFSGLRLGTRAWEAADAHEHDAYLVQQRLRAWLAAAHLPEDAAFAADDGAGVDPDAPEPPFAGGPDHVSFIAPLPDLFGVAGLYRVTVELAAAGDGRALVMSWRLYRPGDEGLAGAAARGDRAGDDSRVLLGDVDAAAFTYFGLNERGDDLVWTETWDITRFLPLLIRIDVERAGQDWPPLLVAPKLGQPVVNRY